MKEPKLPIKPEEYNYRKSIVSELDLKDYEELPLLYLEQIVFEVKQNPTRRIIIDIDHESGYYDSCRYWCYLKVVEFNQKQYDEDMAKYEKDLVEYPALTEQYKQYLKEKKENDKILETKRKYEEYLRLKKEFEFIEKDTI